MTEAVIVGSESDDNAATAVASTSSDFIRTQIAEDVRAGKNGGRVHTRFPPEPNGYLHLGHPKAILLNYSIAQEFGGSFNLRFDDTNPTKEEQEYVDAILEDVRWLGADWEDRLFYASDYFDQLYDFAVKLIKEGKAYVDDHSQEEIREYRGTLTEPGKNSPYRDRSVEENLDLFERMRAGEFPNGARVLRAKIDMSAPNLWLRDPIMYRILHASHHRTGDKWCIYPMYDWAHGQSDAIEGITHSLCTLEFDVHRPLYDWFLEQLDIENPPRQIEFGRLNFSYTVLSKRKLLRLVNEGHVTGWNDPRMPTVTAVRRRGYTPTAIRNLCDRISVAKTNGIVDIAMLEHAVREDLNATAPRVMAVLNPLRVVIENYPEGQVEELQLVNHPQMPEMGARIVPFGRVIYIEKEDFAENPPPKFFRLTVGGEVRLNQAYYITCTGVVKDEQTGEVVELRCTYDPESKGGTTADGRKVKGTLHWVPAEQSLPATVRLYDRLFNKYDPDDAPEGQDYISNLNPDSLQVLTHCLVEPSLAQAAPGDRFQFMRQGYFCVDSIESRPDALVFNRTVSLRDSWAKMG
jgi:glutaminyl-tRNA synthetase